MSVKFSDAKLDQILKHLSEVGNILIDLTKVLAGTEMDVRDWNQTPIGRAQGRVQDVMDILTDEGEEEDDE